MSTSIQQKLNQTNVTDIFNIEDILIFSQVLKKNNGFDYRIPEIVFQQPKDWYFYVKIDGKIDRGCPNLYEYLSVEIGCLPKDKNLFIRGQILKCDASDAKEVKYMMFRFKTTPQTQKTPIEKLTEQVEKLTKQF